jgi:hypothetical protein
LSTTPWWRAALVAGVAYFVVGRAFAWPTTHVGAWRLAAWLVSAVVFAVHIGYEHTRLRHSPRRAAFHASVAVAVGAFLLAIAGMAYSLSHTSTSPLTWLIALAAWPALTALPAFLVAFVTVTLLSRRERNAGIER